MCPYCSILTVNRDIGLCAVMLPAVLHRSEHGFAPQHLGANEILLWFVIKSLWLNVHYSLSGSVQTLALLFWGWSAQHSQVTVFIWLLVQVLRMMKGDLKGTGEEYLLCCFRGSHCCLASALPDSSCLISLSLSFLSYACKVTPLDRHLVWFLLLFQGCPFSCTAWSSWGNEPRGWKIDPLAEFMQG